MNFIFYRQTILGRIGIRQEDGFLTNISFFKLDSTETLEQETPEIAQAFCQMEEYFLKKRKVFDLPLLLKGTEFQKRVWKAVQNVPYGQVRSYKQIAEMIGNVKACRAVGSANHCNPLPVVIPCHRVVGTGGKLVGYAAGLKIKQFLLDLEQNEV